MQQSLNESLVKITKGAGIALVGLLVGSGFAFFSRVLVARISTETQYGVFSLALVVLNFCILVGNLGLPESNARSIAYARGKNDTFRVQLLVAASIQLGLLASIAIGIILFFAADFIAVKIFHDPAIGSPLRIIAAGVPLMTLIKVLVSTFRGFDEAQPSVYFQDVARNVLFVLFLLPIFFFGLAFTSVYYVFLTSLVIPCAAVVMYTIKRRLIPLRLLIKTDSTHVTKELLVFSLPLMGAVLFGMLLDWTDVLMLGSLRTSAEVGLYNAASQLGRFISSPLGALGLLYLPVISGLYARESMTEIRRNFQILVKWLFSATFPLFAVLFLFPGVVLGFFFGDNYAAAADVLRILSLGFITNNILGAGLITLVAMGKSYYAMWATLAGTLLNVGLNWVLIPVFGMEGAAVASVVAINLFNLVVCLKVYRLSRAQPLSKNLLKPMFASLILVSLIYFITIRLVTVSWWMLPLFFVLYYGIYGLTLMLTRSFDREDIDLLLVLERRIGINLAFAKKILRRFAR